jgi:hypothetical protein
MTGTRTFLESLHAYGLVDIDKASTSPRPATPQSRDDETTSAYLRAAVEREAAKVREATEGTRNDALNTAAYSLGQLIAGAGLGENYVRLTLTEAATAAGLGAVETQKTITSGLRAGSNEPRGVPELRPVDTPTITPFELDIDPATLSAQIRERFPVLDWHALWADESEEEWIVEPILPARRLIALYSAPKIGKSLLMLEVAASVAAGRPVLGTQPEERRVLYVDFENDPRADVRERLQAMQFHPDQLGNLYYLSFPTLAALDSERGSEELMAAVAEYQAEVVVIDTVSRSVAGDENENDTWLAFYRHTGLKLKKAQVALIRLDHSGKDETKGQRGVSAKSGDVDAVWRLSRLTDDDYKLECEASRMPIYEKVLTLHREQMPLRHIADARGAAAIPPALEQAWIKALDDAECPKDISKKAAMKVIRGAGMTVSSGSTVLATVLEKRRQTLSEWLGDPLGETLSDFKSERVGEDRYR